MTKTGLGKKIIQGIYFFSFAGISFFLPVFGRIVPLFIVLLLLIWIIDAPFRKTFRLLFRERIRLAIFSFSLLYLLYLLGMIYSHDMKYGWEDLRIKLSLFIFPLIFSLLGEETFTKRKVRWILNFYLIGCVAGSLFLLGHSWYNENRNHMSHAFYYGNLSWYFHSTYLSMYIAFAIAIIAWIIIFGKPMLKPVPKILLLILSIYFMIFIILLSSKAGLVTLSVVMIFYSVLLMVRKKNWIVGLFILVTSFLILYLGMQLFPYASTRISAAENNVAEKGLGEKDKSESTFERIMIWKAGLEIVREHPVLGVGTGDVKDELLLKYSKYNNQQALEKKLNAHNQYIQTAISIGLTGFLVLSCILIIPLVAAFRRGYYLYVIFLLIFTLNIAFESMLEIQAGVVFYSFFNAFLFSAWKGKLVDPS